MTISVVTPPAVTPIACVGLSAIKAHLRVASELTDEDDLIAAYVAAAWEFAEALTWRQLLTATLRLTLPAWECPLLLPKPPLVSVESVKYYDAENELQTWDAANYRVHTTAGVSEIHPVYGVSFPSLYPRGDAVQVEYVAGYGEAAADMPPSLLHAVKLLVGQYYEHREEVGANAAVGHLLSSISCRDERLTRLL